jgi:citrate lyase subunit beta/citryl-CoA lyase
MPRSYLFVPGDSERKLAKGLAGDADALILDLEDSVAPANKEAARTVTAQCVAAQGDARARCWVRVNALTTGLTEADLDAVIAARPAGIFLPKCDGLADVATLADMLARSEAKHGVAPGATRIIGIVTETASAVLNLSSFRGTHPRLAGVMWGAEDLAADLGAASNRDPDGCYAEPFRLARSLTLLAAKAAGVEAIDTVFTDIRDLAKLEAETVAAKRLGFESKAAIHPDQVPVINRVYTPTDDELAWARKVVAAFEANPTAGVLRVEDKMLDRPHLVQARRLLSRS